MNPEIRDAAVEVISEWRSVGYKGSRLRSALTKLDLLLTEDEKANCDCGHLVDDHARWGCPICECTRPRPVLGMSL